MDKLLARYVLNDSRRVLRCAKLGLSRQIFDIEEILNEIQTTVIPAAYPIPVSILIEAFPQYKETWNLLANDLTVEEEQQYRIMYQRIVNNETIVQLFSQKKHNKDYSNLVKEELNAIEDEIRFYSENEKEFKLSDIDEYWEEDKETIAKTIPTPFDKLTKQLQGGWLPGRVYIFEAAPESKKTMLMLYFAFWLSRLGFKIQYISTELIDLDFRERMFSIARGTLNPECIGELKWSDSSEEEKKPIVDLLKECGKNITYKFFSSTTMRQVERYLEGQEYDLLILDHPSEYRIIPNYPTNNDKKWEVEEKVFGDIFSFCRKTRKPVLVPSFVTKSAMEFIKKGSGGGDMWQGTGSVGKSAIVDAKYCLMLETAITDDKGRTKQRVTLQPVKLRRTGKYGMKKEPISLEFNGDSGLFYEAVTAATVNAINPESKNWGMKE